MSGTVMYQSTPLQHGLLFNSLSASEAGVDIIQVICDLPERIHVESLLLAWRRISARHEMLRAAFRWEEMEQPRLEIFPVVTVSMHTEDLCGLTEAASNAYLEEFLRRDRRQAFVPWVPPLWRVAIFTLAPQQYCCVFTFHHAILDGRSLPLILREVFASYRAIVSGTPQTLPPAPSYQAYSSWWQQQDQAADESFWRQMLADIEAPIALPEEGRVSVDMATEPSPLEGASHVEQKLCLTAELCSALHRLAEAHQLTINAIIQGAWALLLHGYSGQQDIVFGEIRSCRQKAVEGIEEMVGFFLNTLPMRIHVDPSMPLIPWLQGIRASHRSLRAHQLTPLQQVQQWSQVPPGTSLFTSLFVFERMSLQHLLQKQDPDWLPRRVMLRRKPSYPLTLYVFAEPEVVLTFVYDPRLFSSVTIERLLSQLRHVLAQMVTAPDTTLSALSLLLPEDRRQMLITWNATAYPFERQTCIHQRIEAVAARTPQALAIHMGTRQLTYDELNRRANQLAYELRSRGVAPETQVCVCMHRSPEMIIGQLAVLKAGGAFVSLDPDTPKERLAFMMHDAQATILLTSTGLRQRFSDSPLQIIALDTETHLLASWPGDNLPSLVSPAHLAYSIYTSGSTGQPKGVAIQHESLLNLVSWHQHTYTLTASDRTTHLASPAFDASIWEIWPALAVGASLYLPDQETILNPRMLVDWYTTHNITISFLPTPLGEAVLQEQWPGESVLRALLVGGDRLQRVPESSLPFRLYNHYGLTETTVVATATPILPRTSLVPAIGRPIDNTQIYLLNEQGQPVPVGATGELCVGGESLARGYLYRPDLTAERFVPHPFSNEPGVRLYKTGDLARYRVDGQIEFLGRRDHQIKVRGHRIELGEIEATLVQHPSIATALALVVDLSPDQSGQGEQRLTAYVVPHQGVTLTSDDLQCFLRQKLPTYMIPTSIVQLDALPLTSNGKVDRRALPLPTRVPDVGHITTPRTPLEMEVAEIWAHVLGLNAQVPLNINESFFALGGHSLRAAQLMLRLNERFQLQLSMQSIFHASTIAHMAALIAEKRKSQDKEAPMTIPTLDRRRYRLQKKDETHS